MVHPPTPESTTRARVQSDRAVLELITSMTALASRQRSVSSILRYMLAAHNYKITHVVLGSYPYGDNVVPTYGSAYAQCTASPDTPTIDIIKRHFYQNADDSAIVVDCFRNSWRTLLCGYLWMNIMYAKPTGDTNDVDRVRDIEYMHEFLCRLLLYQREHFRIDSVIILALGREAQYVASNMSRRLKSQNIGCTITSCPQPALLSRVTYNRDKIGVDNNYICFTPSAIKFISRVASLYRGVQGTPESRIVCAMPSAIDSLISSGIQALAAEALTLSMTAEQTNCNVDMTQDASAQVNQLVKHHKTLLAIQCKQTALIQKLIEIISTNAFVSATIQDRVIGSVAASVASQPISAVTTRVETIAHTKLPQTVTHLKSMVDDQSSVTESMDDIFSPMVLPRATVFSPSTPSAPRGQLKFNSKPNTPSDSLVTDEDEVRNIMQSMQSFKGPV